MKRFVAMGVATLALTAPAVAQAACPNALLKVSATNTAKVDAAALCLVNEQRTRRSLPKLRSIFRLRNAATAHDLDMLRRGYFAHVSPKGERPDQRASKAGYKWTVVAENIGEGFRTAQALVNGWMRSSGHRSNLLSRSFADGGIAGRKRGSRVVWTMLLGHT